MKLMGLFNIYKGLPKSVYIIFFAQIINRFGDFVMPFLSLLLIKKLGLSYQSAGLAVMFAALSSVPGSFIGGKIADHFGRKKTYLFFQGAAGASLLSCVFFTNPHIIIALVCISTFLNGGVRPIISAVITDVLPAEKRQQGFSLSYLGINIGVALGPIVSGFLFNRYIPLIFIGDAITSFIAVALVAFNIEETMPDKSKCESTRTEEKHEEGNVITVLLRRPQIIVFLFITILLSIVYTQHTFSLPMMLDKVFSGDGPRYYGINMSFNAVTVLLMTMIVTQATKRWHPLSAIAVTGLLYAAGFGMVALVNSLPLFLVSTYIWTIGEILTVTNFGVYIANNTPQNFRARFNAVTSLSWAAGASLGTSVMGIYIDKLGIDAVWPLTFILGILGSIGMYTLKLKTDKAKTDAVDIGSSASDSEC
ncbi:MAG: MDR family MFS transporter [Bacillota bacterium]